MGLNSFGTAGRISVGGTDYTVERLDALPGEFGVDRLPYSLKVLLENLLRHEDGEVVTAADIAALASAAGAGSPSGARSPSPRPASCSRTSPVCRASSTSPRCATPSGSLGGDPGCVQSPGIPGRPRHRPLRDRRRGRLAWTLLGDERASRTRAQRRALPVPPLGPAGVSPCLRVVPPDTGICHQVNLELAQPVSSLRRLSGARPTPTRLVGTDSHTTMVNGLGVVGWGDGGIEAEAAMLGQPISMLAPRSSGSGSEARPVEGATATDSSSRSPSLRAPRRRRQVRRELWPGPRQACPRDRATI